MSGAVRIAFGAITPPPAPLYVAWIESDEHYYVLSDADPDLEDGPYSSKWMARTRAVRLSALLNPAETDANSRPEGTAGNLPPDTPNSLPSGPETRG